MTRRDFLTFLGAAAAWSLTARAQQGGPLRRIGVMMSVIGSDEAGQAEIKGLQQGLRDHGWIEGRNLQIDYRWPGGELDRIGALAREMVALRPEVIMARSTPITAALMRETPTIPIIFVQVSEPVASGFVQSLARPGGHVTGFTNVEPSMGSKWLELLKEVSPAVRRAAVLYNPATAPYAGAFFGTAAAAGRTLGVAVSASEVHSVAEIESAISAFAREAGGGLIAIPDTFVQEHRELVIRLAAEHRLPAVYGNRAYVASGGLLTYAVDTPDLFRRSAAYVDRILKGANPGELPVQQPVKYELVINLKAAKALGLTVADQFIALADEVIE